MHLVLKLASSIIVASTLLACSSTQTSSVNFDPNALPATASGTMPLANGYVRYWEYSNIEGRNLASLYASPDYPLLYSKSSRLSSMNKTTKLSNGGIRMAGYLYPAVSGEYYFKLQTNSGGELWISSDDKAYKKKKIIHLDGNNADVEASVEASVEAGVEAGERATLDNTAPQSAQTKHSIKLEAGKRYFIEAIAKINNSGETLNVFWSYPITTDSGTIHSRMAIIPASVMRSYSRNKVETPSADYIDGMKAGYTQGFNDARLGLNYLEEFPPTDTDFDGIPDRWEEAYGLNPLSYSDASLDKDGDGLSAFDEYMARTEPYNRDSDNDGIPDGWEISNNLNPLYAGDALTISPLTNLSYLAMWQEEAGVVPGLYITWQAPTQRVNGESLNQTEIKSYTIHYKLVDESEYTKVLINTPETTEINIRDAEPGTYNVGITVIDTNGLESEMSTIADKIVE